MRTGSVSASLLAAAGVLLLGTVPGALAADRSERQRNGPPLGHPDFYPSSERPIGWRGDGTGAWPGATPVTDWDCRQGRNIVWRAKMPAPSWSQPAVAGEKVFVMSDPDLLLCLDARTGKELWRRALDHTRAMPPDRAKLARSEMEFFERQRQEYYEWRRAVDRFREMLEAEAHLKGAATRALRGMGKREPPPALQEAMEESPELKELYERIKEGAVEKKFCVKTDCNSPFIAGYKCWAKPEDKNEDYHRAERALAEFDIWPWAGQLWYNDCGLTMSSPTTDGEFVYATGPSNQVACYDFDGACKWLRWDHPKEPQDLLMHTRFVASPLLVGDVLVVNQNAEIRAYDKRTGRKVWGIVDPYRKFRHKRDPNRINRPYRPHPEGCSPARIRLSLDGKPHDFVTDGGGQVYRASDGRVVCTGLPDMLKGASPVCPDDLYIWKTGGDNVPSTRGVCRLTLVSPDRLEFGEIWREKYKGLAEMTDIYWQGFIYDGLGARWNALTGEKTPCERLPVKWCSPSLAGGHVFCVSTDGKKGVSEAGVLSLATLTRVASPEIVDRAAEDPEWLAGFVYQLGEDRISCSSPVFAGNRMLFRTAGYLYCIGDPRQPWHTPEDAHPSSRVEGQVIGP